MAVNQKKGRRCFLELLLLCMTAAALVACGEERESERGKDWDYTVVPTADCPGDLLAEIEKKKINAFQMTYDDGTYTYLAVGYGEQETGGFSIQVLGLYEQGEELCLETSLIGPGEDAIVSSKKSTPYIVIKTQKSEKIINFL